jgi:hypothetical protein
LFAGLFDKIKPRAVKFLLSIDRRKWGVILSVAACIPPQRISGVTDAG